MPAQIRPTRLEVSDRFPMLGFSIRAEGPPQRAEVVLASEPGLFGIEGKPRRTVANFYSTRASSPLKIAGGEAVYIVPTEVLARFVGKEKLYFGLATARDGDTGPMQVAVRPTDGSPYVSLKGLTGRSMQRVRMLPNRQQRAAGYSNGTQATFEWAGDDATPGMEPVGGGRPAAAAPSGNGVANPEPAQVPYDDGFGPMPPKAAATPNASPASPAAATPPSAAAAPAAMGLSRAGFALAVEVPDDRGIEGPAYSEEDGQAVEVTQARGLGATAPEYPGASRFAPAPGSAFMAMATPRTISRIVIHVTDAPSTSSTVNTFTHPGARVSSHYLVGQDGEVIQFVQENDIAFHAHGANGDSIGIEHVAIQRAGATYKRSDGSSLHFNHLPPTDAQYCASAALVTYLCDKYGLTPDRLHILGHAEVDPSTDHKACPSGADWDWDHYIRLVAGRYCAPRSAASVEQALGVPSRRPVPRAVSRSLAQVVQAYAPSDARDAARALADFARREAAWRAGVPSTGFFPHSAICHLELTDPAGALFYGTAFYVADDLLLSVAHNFAGMATARILAGRNGSGSFLSDFSVGPGDWSIHPAYVAGVTDHDLAVVRVSTPPPGRAAFDLLEELNVSRDSRVIVCGYGAETVDPFVQHLDGDAVRELSANGEVMRYNLQTEKGNSGSPVFQLWGYEDEARQMSVQDIRLVAVHSASYDATVNQACRLTANKIAWIRGRGLVSVAQAMSYRPRPAQPLPRALSGGAFSLNWDEVESIAQPTGLSCWAAAASMVIGWRDRVSLTPEAVATICSRPLGAALKAVNFEAFAREMGLSYEYPVCYTVDGFRTLIENKGPLWVFALVPSGHAIVVTGLYSDGSRTFVRITDPWDRDIGAPGAPGGYLPTHATGSRYIMSWDAFTAEYEAGSNAMLQILHSGGSAGRMPNTSATAPPGYAQALSRDGLRNAQAFAGGGEAAGDAGPRQRRITGSINGVSWDLAQYEGLKSPARAAVGAGQAVADGPPVDLGDWPYVHASNPEAPLADCSRAPLTVLWRYRAGAVGDVRITPGAFQARDGWTIAVTAGITEEADAADVASLRVTVRTVFSTPGEADNVALTSVTLFGDGRPPVREDAWAVAAARIPA
ncbi:N-acetylmuramoyl-L-alanine amidase [Paraburkholderia xenovorans]|uniref:N-acetylmuramoyl-L-alanine amidase n=1 Tax=Paraburkholderia xenovorans TaxID=36873 RepID=UPI0038BB7D04